MKSFEDKKNKVDLHQRFTRRSMLIAAGQLGLLTLLGRQLYRLQVENGEQYSRLADRNRTTIRQLPPIRGRILDRFGEVLASNRENLQLMLVPDLAGDVTGVLEDLAEIIKIPDEQVQAVIAKSKNQSPYLPILIAEKISWKEFARVNVLAPQFPGIQAVIGAQREYFHGADMSHVVGYVGAPDEIEISESPTLRLPGMRVGKSGIERGNEESLRGLGGHQKIEINARGRITNTLDRQRSRNGSDTIITVDHELQAFAMKLLRTKRRASLVAMDVLQGDIIIMASVPTFDANELVSGITEENWNNLKANSENALSNKAIRGQYPPGSTFKMVTALAGLETGVITPETSVECSGNYEYGGHDFRCWNKKGHKLTSLHKAITESCDVYFYEAARRIGISKISEMAHRLGLGTIYNFELPLQKEGLIPDPSWKRAHLNQTWLGGETVLAGIGQGYVLATPLQLAVMTARLATGNVINPKILHSGPDSIPVDADTIAVNSSHLELIQQAMFSAVNDENGTGKSAQLPWADKHMAGKTGTSQVVRLARSRNRKRSWKDKDHSLFVGYAPAENPRYAVSAVVEHGGAGSKVAAPIAQKVMKKLLEKDPLSKPHFSMMPLDTETVIGTDAEAG